MNFFVEELFETILSLFNQTEACLEFRDGDKAELLSRRLEQYEQTLRVMHQRLTETCPHQEAIRHDVEQLMNALRCIFYFRKFKVVLNPLRKFFVNFSKSCILSC